MSRVGKAAGDKWVREKNAVIAKDTAEGKPRRCGLPLCEMSGQKTGRKSGGTEEGKTNEQAVFEVSCLASNTRNQNKEVSGM